MQKHISFSVILFALLFVGNCVATISIADDCSNGFWRRPSVFWRAGAEWEVREIPRSGFTEIPTDCIVFFISIPDKYIRDKNSFFRFKRSDLPEARGYVHYVIHWAPNDRMIPLWLVAVKKKNPARYCRATPVKDPRLRAGTTTAFSMHDNAFIQGAGV